MSGPDRPEPRRRRWLIALGLAALLTGLMLSVLRARRPEPPLRRLAALKADRSKVEIPLAFSPDGSLLATRNEGGLVTLWDVATHRPRPGPKLHADSVRAEFSPDGRFLALSSLERATIFHIVRVVEVATGREVLSTEVGLPNLSAYRFAPDGSTFWLAAGQHSFPNVAPLIVRTWDTSTWREGPSRSVVPPQPTSIHRVAAISPDGKVGATVSAYAPDVLLWDTDTGATLATLPTPLKPPALGNYAVEFSPDGGSLAVGRNNDGLMELWDVPTRTLRQTFHGLGTGDRVNWVRFDSRPSRTLVTTVGNWGAHQSAPSQLLRRLGRKFGLSPSVTIIPTDVVVWDVPSGRIVARLKGEALGIVSPDGSTLATMGHGAVNLWDLRPK